MAARGRAADGGGGGLDKVGDEVGECGGRVRVDASAGGSHARAVAGEMLQYVVSDDVTLRSLVLVALASHSTIQVPHGAVVPGPVTPVQNFAAVACKEVHTRVSLITWLK